MDKKPHEQEWSAKPGKTGVERGVYRGNTMLFSMTPNATGEDASVAAAAPEMARALMAVKECVVETASRSMPGRRTAEELSEMDMTVPIPTSILRDMLAALRKAGVIP